MPSIVRVIKLFAHIDLHVVLRRNMSALESMRRTADTDASCYIQTISKKTEIAVSSVRASQAILYATFAFASSCVEIIPRIAGDAHVSVI
jgi:hypothetical protein